MKRYSAAVIMFLVMLFLSLPAHASGAGKVLREKTIREAVRSFILERTKGTGMEIRIKKIGFSGDIAAPPGDVTYEFSASRQWQGWGRSILGMVIRVDGRVVKNMSIPVEVEALAEMVVALRPLERGETIAEGDVALEKRDLASTAGRICRDTGEVIGKRARVLLRANMPVRADYLEKVPLVKYGQLVTIVADNGSIRVTTAGKTKGAGAEGDAVTVQNLASKKDVQARVVDSGTVAVDF